MKCHETCNDLLVVHMLGYCGDGSSNLCNSSFFFRLLIFAMLVDDPRTLTVFREVRGVVVVGVIELKLHLNTNCQYLILIFVFYFIKLFLGLKKNGTGEIGQEKVCNSCGY